MTVKIEEVAQSAAPKIHPILKCIYYTPGVTTGVEDTFDADGNANFERTMQDIVSTTSKVERWGLPYILIGQPGSAKTSSVKAASKAMGMKCFTLIASLCDPTDFRGIPTIATIKTDDPNGKIRRYNGTETIMAIGNEPLYMKDDKGNFITIAGEFRPADLQFTPMRGEPIHNFDGSIKRKKKEMQVSRTAIPEIFIQLAKLGDCTLFLDEFSTAQPAVQAALLRVALDLVVGDFKLPPGIRIVAAMNSTDQAANGSDIALPLANRFGHYKWSNPSNQAWCDWMISGSQSVVNSLDPKAEQARVLKRWDYEFSLAKGLVCGYISRRGDNALSKIPNAQDENASAAYPTPRSWDLATRAFAGAAIHGLSDQDRNELLSSFIGIPAASEFLTFVREVDLPDPIALLDGKETFNHKASKLDRTVAALMSMTSVILNNASTPEAVALKKKRVEMLWKILNDIFELKTGEDLIVPTVKLLVVNGLFANGSKISLDLIGKLGIYLSEAEIVYKEN